MSSDRIDVEDELVTTTNRVIIETILSLRGGERFNSVVEEFGRDAELLAVAIGKGNTRQPTTVDVYFDDLVVADRTFDVPAVVNSSATFDPKTIGPSEEGFHVHLQFEDTALEDAGLALEDIALDSVMLSGYAPIAPPIAGTDIQSAAVSRENGATGRMTDEGIRVDFDPDEVANLLEPSTTTVLLFGEFAVDRPLSFLATGEITFEE